MFKSFALVALQAHIAIAQPSLDDMKDRGFSAEQKECASRGNFWNGSVCIISAANECRAIIDHTYDYVAGACITKWEDENMTEDTWRAKEACEAGEYKKYRNDKCINEWEYFGFESLEAMLAFDASRDVALAQTHAQTESSPNTAYTAAAGAFGFVAGAASIVLIGTCSKKASSES